MKQLPINKTIQHRRQFIKNLAGGVMGANVFPASSVAQSKKTRLPRDVDDPAAINIVFTGTGAADWPSEYPDNAASLANGAFRGNSGAVFDSSLMIDCGRNVPDALVSHGIDISSLSDLFLTHSHGDHINSEALSRLYDMTGKEKTLRIWGHAKALERIEIPDAFEQRPLEAMATVDTGCFAVTALPANHVVGNSTEIPLHFLLEKGGKRVLYGADGAWFLKATWLYLRERPLDALIWDATIGDVDGDWRIFEHNSLDMIRLMIRTLNKQNVLNAGSRNILTHLARTLWPVHAEVEALLTDENIIAARDGMKCKV